METKEKQREEIEIINSDEEFPYFISRGPWEIHGNEYEFVKKTVNDGDIEPKHVRHNVLIRRKQDNKYFEYEWLYMVDPKITFFNSDDLVEVFDNEVQQWGKK